VGRDDEGQGRRAKVDYTARLCERCTRHDAGVP
jgi:hypothetical protein